MTREFDVEIERDDEGHCVATVPALAGCHTQARSPDELFLRIKEAVLLCLKVQGEPVADAEMQLETGFITGTGRIRVA